MKAFPSPNIRPQPITQNEIVEAANTMKFLARMLVQFLARHSPLSTSAKPAFIQNTSIAVTSTQTVSMPTRMALLLSISAWSSGVAPSLDCPHARADPSSANIPSATANEKFRERNDFTFDLPEDMASGAQDTACTRANRPGARFAAASQQVPCRVRTAPTRPGRRVSAHPGVPAPARLPLIRAHRGADCPSLECRRERCKQRPSAQMGRMMHTWR